MIEETFLILRSCGKNTFECQVYWLSSWDNPIFLSEVVHPKHYSNQYGINVENNWISSFWLDLATKGLGVRVQVHTHPDEAFHSATDDAFPLLSNIGFLSLVIPDFAMGPIGFRDAYLTEIQSDGSWKEVGIPSRFVVDD